MKRPQRATTSLAALSLTLGFTLAGALGQPVAAKTSSTTVNGTAFGPADLRLARIQCSDPVVPITGQSAVSTAMDEQAPLGDRALTATTDASSGGVGPLAPLRQPQNLVSMRASLTSLSGSDDIAAVVRYRPDASDSTWWGLAPLDASVGSYEEVEAATSVFTWSRIGADGQREASGGQRTLQDFFGSARTPGRIHAGFLLGCAGGEMRMDGLTVSTPKSERVWNFEGAKPRLAMAFKPSTAVFGRTVTARTRITSEEEGERPVTLERKTNNGSVEVDRVVLDHGKDSFRMKAKTSGRYRLTLAPTELSEAASSSWTRLRVPFKVSAASSKRSVEKGRTFSISGAISPSAQGTVTVQRLSGGRWVKATSTRWSGGRYAVRVRATPLGDQVFRVLTTRTATNDPGTSGRVRVTVTAPPPPTGGGDSGGDSGGGGGGGSGDGSGGSEEPPEGPQRPVR